MSNCSESFNIPWAWKMDQDNIEKYGTDDYDIIQLIKAHTEKNAEAMAEILSEEKAEEKFQDKKERYCLEIRKEIREEYRITKGIEITRLSPFISESVKVNGQELVRQDFIPDTFKRDPQYTDKQLNLNPYNGHWQMTSKVSGPKYISSVDVIACLIVNVAGPGKYYALVVFIKGRGSPLIFIGGNLSTHNIMTQLQLDDTSLNEKWVAEAFRRSLLMCSYVFFLTLPEHAGWNLTPNGLRKFVCSDLAVPELIGLFNDKRNTLRNVCLDITLEPTERTIKEIVVDYKRLCPDTLPVKIGTVISVTSRFLTFYKDDGLVQDRLWVVEATDDSTVRSMTAIMQNKNHRLLCTSFSSDRRSDIEAEMKKCIDCTFLVQYRGYLENKYDIEKILKILSRIIPSDNESNRIFPVLILDKAGVIPEEFPVYCITISEFIYIENIDKVQKVTGELDYILIKYAEQNPDAIKRLLKNSEQLAKQLMSRLSYVEKSNSMKMFLSTAIMLRRFGILTGTDIQNMTQWFAAEATSRTSADDAICNEIGAVLNKIICNGELPIARQEGPPFYYRNKCMAFIAQIDGSINFELDTFDRVILPKLKSTAKRNKVLNALHDNGLLYFTKDHKRDLKVKLEGRATQKIRTYSISDSLLNDESRSVVDKAIMSDLFHNPDKSISNFSPYIKHERFDLVAGPIITDYKQGNPFICVTGTPGSGKTDWCMMQAIQRAKSGDTVIVLDPTNSFNEEELIGHSIPQEIIDKYFSFWDMSMEGFPVDLLDFSGCEDIEQMTQRLSSLLISGTHITGCNQKAILMCKVEEWLEKRMIEKKMSLFEITSFFENKPDENKIHTRIKALFGTVKNSTNTPPGWAGLLASGGKIFVISSGNATINCDANPLDIVLDTLYGFKDKHRDAKVTIILDEFQTLNHHKGSTLESLLSRARKLNISAILASQVYSNSEDSLGRIYSYCGTRVFFRPMEKCIDDVTKVTHIDEEIISILPNFYCAITGAVYSEYYGKNISISSAILGKTYRPPEIGSYDEDVEEQ